MIWKLTKDSKRHLPGAEIDGIQRCVRCKTRLNRRVYSSLFWPIGMEIITNRSGSGRAEGYSNASDIRLCGSQRQRVDAALKSGVDIMASLKKALAESKGRKDAHQGKA